MAKPSDLRAKFDRKIQTGKNVEETIMAALQDLSSLSTLNEMETSKTGEKQLKDTIRQRQYLYSYLRNYAKERNIDLTLDSELIKKLRSVGITVANLKSIDFAIEKLQKKEATVTVDALNAILSNLQTLNPLTEGKRETHDDMRKARTDRYNKVFALAKQHGISITLTSDQKAVLRRLGVSIPPTYTETFVSYYDDFRGRMSAATGVVANKAEDMYGYVSDIAALTTAAVSDGLMDAAIDLKNGAGALATKVEELAEATTDGLASISSTARDVTDNTIYVVTEVSKIPAYIEAQQMALVKGTLGMVSDMVAEIKDAGGAILGAMREVTAAEEDVRRLFESTDVSMTNQEPGNILVTQDNISTVLDRAEAAAQEGQTHAVVALEHADGTREMYTFAPELLRQLLAGNPRNHLDPAVLSVLESIRNAIMQPHGAQVWIGFVTPEVAMQMMPIASSDMHDHTNEQSLIMDSANSESPNPPSIPRQPGPAAPEHLGPIVPPNIKLMNALQNRFAPLLENFMSELLTANIAINNGHGDDRIRLLHAHLSHIKWQLEDSKTLQQTESVLEELMTTVEHAEKEFKHETGVWRYIQPILNGIAAVAISIAAFCSRPFMEQASHQAFVKEWSKTPESKAQVIYKNSQAKAVFFSAAEGKDEQERITQEHPGALPPQAGGRRG